MKITLLTFYSREYQSLADITVPNKEEYCRRAGYEHIVRTGPYANAAYYYAVDRLIFLKDLLSRSTGAPELVWVLNLHTYIMNYQKRLEEVVSEEHDFFISADCHGLNAGSFVVRRSEWSCRWLDFIIGEALRGNHHWHEQKVMQDHAGDPEWRDKIRILPQNAINSYDYRLYNMSESTEGQFRRGDLLFHAPGIAYYETCSLLEARVKLFSGAWIRENFVS